MRVALPVWQAVVLPLKGCVVVLLREQEAVVGERIVLQREACTVHVADLLAGGDVGRLESKEQVALVDGGAWHALVEKLWHERVPPRPRLLAG